VELDARELPVRRAGLAVLFLDDVARLRDGCLRPGRRRRGRRREAQEAGGRQAGRGDAFHRRSPVWFELPGWTIPTGQGGGKGKCPHEPRSVFPSRRSGKLRYSPHGASQKFAAPPRRCASPERKGSVMWKRVLPWFAVAGVVTALTLLATSKAADPAAPAPAA